MLNFQCCSRFNTDVIRIELTGNVFFCVESDELNEGELGYLSFTADSLAGNVDGFCRIFYSSVAGSIPWV